MTMHKALHPRDDVDRLYVSRKEGGKVLACIDDSVVASIQRLEYNIKTQRKTDNSHPKHYWKYEDQHTTITRKQK